MYLEKINSSADIKKLSLNELQPLADEVRKALINKISKAGGHQGPNLGVVELTVALHYVFDTPRDKLVFDVSHQCYPHKILTGRKQAFLEEEHFHDVTGYTNPLESEYDLFTIGHTSTSVSLALGLCKGRDVNGRNENVIALIGDGSLSGGEALEALDTAGEYNGNLIIIVNDNDQSIAENHGGLYKTLKKLRETNGKCEENLFKGFGLEYKYIDDGHDIKKLVQVLQSVKNRTKPVVVHVHTIKGKGLPYAEKNREEYHAGGPFNVEDGSPKYSYEEDSTVYQSLIELLENDKKSVIVNAGTPMGLGFVGKVRDEWEKKGRFIDVGIAEENGVAMTSGIARNGGTAVFGTYASFFQRTYDQMSHDVCLNSSSATFIILEAGIYGSNSNTHIALCDISMFAHIPNLIYLAPTSKEEYEAMFKFATTQKKNPVAIRVPLKMQKTGIKDSTDYSKLNRNQIVNKGSKIAIFGVSNMLPRALEAAAEYKKQTGVEVTVINPKFLTGLDEQLLKSLEQNHEFVITLEDGEAEGGYGSRIASFYGCSKMKVKTLGISKVFYTDFDAEDILDKEGMSVEKLVQLMKLYS